MKLKVIISGLLIVFWLSMEVYYQIDTRSVEKKIDNLQILELNENFEGPGSYIARGKLTATELVKAYNLIDIADKLLFAYIKVEVFQSVREKRQPGNVNTIYYEFVPQFVEYGSHEWNQVQKYEKKKNTQNYDSWPVRYKSEHFSANNFFFRESYKLDKASLVLAVSNPDNRYAPSQFLAPYDLRNPPQLLEQEPIHNKKGEYYYGKDPDNPEIGDIRIRIYAMENGKAITLGGIFDGKAIKPFQNEEKYYTLPYSYYSEDQIREKFTQKNTAATGALLWLARVMVAILVIVTLYSSIKKKFS